MKSYNGYEYSINIPFALAGSLSALTINDINAYNFNNSYLRNIEQLNICRDVIYANQFKRTFSNTGITKLCNTSLWNSDISAENVFYETFLNCISITGNINLTSVGFKCDSNCFNKTFLNCSNIQSVSCSDSAYIKLPENCSAVFYQTFSYCSKLTDANILLSGHVRN